MRITSSEDGRFINATFNIEDFLGGLNENKNIAENQSPALLNVYLDDNGNLRPRPFLDKTYDLNNYKVKKTFTYTNKENSEVAIVSDYKTIMYSLDLKNWSYVPNTNGNGNLELDENYEIRFTSYQNDLWITNGKDKIYKWDGGANSTEYDWFDEGDRPSFIITHLNRIFFAKTPLNLNYLYYTNVGATNLPPVNLIAVESLKSGRITGLAVCQRGLIIFKSDSTWLLTGYDETSFALTCISNEIGCINDNSIQEYMTDIIFLAQDGFYKTDGVNLVKLPDFVYPTIRKISQSFNWTFYERTISETAWDRLKDDNDNGLGTPTYFIPNENNPINVYFSRDTLYNKMTAGLAPIWYKNDGTGFSKWKVWGQANLWEIEGTTRAPISGHEGEIGLMGWGAYDTSIVTCELYTEEGEFVRELFYEYTTRYDEHEPYIKPLYTRIINLSNIGLLEEEYKYKRFKIRFNYRVFDPIWTKGDDILVSSMELIEPIFLCQHSTGSLQITYRVNSAYPYLANYTFEIVSIWGRGLFTNLIYYTQPMVISQKKWGVLSYNYFDYQLDEIGGSGYATKRVLMRFSNDNGSSWSNWIEIPNGANIGNYDPYNNSSNRTNKIQIAVEGRPPGGAGYCDLPLRFNTIYFSWFDCIADILQSENNLSSIVYKNRYYLAYTLYNEAYNKYIILYEENFKIPKFFKWYSGENLAILEFLIFGNELFIFIEDKTNNNIYICSLKDLPSQNYYYIYDCFYFTKNFNFSLPGIVKDFDTLILLKDKINNGIDDLKVELYIGDKYNGDLDIYLRERTSEYFSLKHGTLRLHNNLLGNPRLLLHYPNYYSELASQSFGYTSWDSSVVPFGFGENLQFRFFWGIIDIGNKNIKILNNSSLNIIKELSLDMFIHRDLFLEPKLNLYEGEL